MRTLHGSRIARQELVINLRGTFRVTFFCEAACQTGIGEGRLSKIVNGWIEPTEPERELIAQALGRDPDELFERQEVTA